LDRCIAPAYSFTSISYTWGLPPYAGATAQSRSSFPAENKNRNAGINVMTNTAERATARVFGLSLTGLFIGLLILNSISF
jgi:hypothetical protein